MLCLALQLPPKLPDLNMALAKIFPTLMERTALSGLAGDVKAGPHSRAACARKIGRTAELHIVQVGVASDKLVQQLAKHPKARCNSYRKLATEQQCQVGCEAVTKMAESFVLAASAGVSLHSSCSCAR